MAAIVQTKDATNDVPEFNTIVRVKRKRTDKPVPPDFLVFQQQSKKVKLHDAMNNLGIETAGDAKTTVKKENESQPLGVVCELVQTLPVKTIDDEDTKQIVSKIKQKMNENYKQKFLKSLPSHYERAVQGMKGRTKNAREQALQLRRQKDPDIFENNFQVVDMDLNSKKDKTMTSHLQLNGKPVIRKLNAVDGGKFEKPVDQKMDFEIWNAFNNNEFKGLLDLVDNGLIDVNFSRPKDGIVALMTACRHGREEIIRKSFPHFQPNAIYYVSEKVMIYLLLFFCYRKTGHLLKLGADVTLEDIYKNGPLNHVDLSPTLDQAQKEKIKSIIKEFMLKTPEERKQFQYSESDDEMDTDYVYDIYCVQRPITKNERMGDNTHILDSNALVSQTVLSSVGLYEDELVHDFPLDGQEDEVIDDDDDSNAEDYEGNSYPDEDEFDDDYSESDNEHGRLGSDPYYGNNGNTVPYCQGGAGYSDELDYNDDSDY